MDPTVHSSSSLPTDLREYAIFLQKKESEELEAIPISSSSESESDEEPGPPWSAKDLILDKLNSQTHAHLNALFLTRQIVQPPVDIMMNMSPFSKAKFRHRSDSNDYEHMKISMRKKLPTLLEESKKREKQWTLDDFEKGRLLGRGRFAHVWLAKEKSTGLVVVLKAISKAKVQKYRSEKALRTEIEVQSHLDHPSIVRLYAFFHDKSHIYLVLEYALEGDLFNFLKRNSVDIDITGLFVYNIANALRYMHANKILHRDLKPENIFINHLGQIKIADFGWSCHSHKPFQFVIVGTTQYMAPEMLKGRGYGSTVDIWSLGILFYEMLTGELPFCGDSYEDITEAILHSDWSIPHEESFPPGAVHLLKRLLTRNPAERITVDEIMTHPWIVECIQRIDAF